MHHILTTFVSFVYNLYLEEPGRLEVAKLSP